MRPKYLWPVLLGLAAGCGGGAAVTDGGESSGESATAADAGGDATASASSDTTAEAAPAAPKPAPTPTVDRPMADDFELNDLDGNAVSLSGLKGKVVLLAFWGID